MTPADLGNLTMILAGLMLSIWLLTVSGRQQRRNMTAWWQSRKVRNMDLDRAWIEAEARRREEA